MSPQLNLASPPGLVQISSDVGMNTVYYNVSIVNTQDIDAFFVNQETNTSGIRSRKRDFAMNPGLCEAQPAMLGSTA